MIAEASIIPEVGIRKHPQIRYSSLDRKASLGSSRCREEERAPQQGRELLNDGRANELVDGNALAFGHLLEPLVQ
jgi:hypothetical protein